MRLTVDRARPLAAGDHRDLAAVILAVGLVAALNIIVIAVLYDAIVSSDSGLSENATQILTGWGGGIIGIVGGWLGYRAGSTEAAKPEPPPAGSADE